VRAALRSAVAVGATLAGCVPATRESVPPAPTTTVATTTTVTTATTVAPAGAADARPLPEATLRRLRDTVRHVLDAATADRAFPGAIAVVGNRDGVLAEYAVGRIDWDPAAPKPDARTIWDLASLTKVLATTSAIMQLVEQGKVSLDAPVQRYLTEWTGPGREAVTIRHLITHSSGLPPFKVFPMDASADSTRKLFLGVPLDSAPGARMAYSDIGFVLLGLVVERVSGETLDRYVARHLYEPLGMRDTYYRPPASELARVAPTETQAFRGGQVRGIVHDERAWRMDGVAGHAGLFSTAADLALIARAYLNGGALGGARVFAESTVTRFTSYADSTYSNRGLGWQKPERPGMRFTGPSAAWGGRSASSRAFGHTGFTGTSIWIDPERDLFVVLLTNRVNPTRDNPRITPVRARLADAVAAALSSPSAPQ
jgi:CubicO group peptidase (beta-lactamase class C family)